MPERCGAASRSFVRRFDVEESARRSRSYLSESCIVTMSAWNDTKLASTDVSNAFLTFTVTEIALTLTVELLVSSSVSCANGLMSEIAHL